MPEQGNWFVVFAILGWPVVALGAYLFRPALEATAWTIVGSLLFLPSNAGIKFDMVPAIDKSLVSAMSAFVGCAILIKRPKVVPIGLGVFPFLILLYVLGPLFTSLSNGDTLVYGPVVLPGVGMYDGTSASITQLITFFPFLLGQRYFQGDRAVQVILRVLVIAGLIYSVLMLIEIRVSPQLSLWLYGYLPSTYVAEMRYGGFRPVVFMQNGLAAAFFLMTALIAAVVFWRGSSVSGKSTRAAIVGYLFVVLLLCKSAGAMIYAIACGPIVRFAGPRMQTILAALIVIICLLYPLFRIAAYIPEENILGVSSFFNQERAESLGFRFEQEKQIMARTAERLIFGWGRYGRNRVYDENGKDVSVTDGAWIITLSQFGIVGFLGQFGLLGLPVFWAFRAIKRDQVRGEEQLPLAGLALIVSISLMEQIPNASISSWTWLLSGVLLGRSQRLLRRRFSSTSAIRAAHINRSLHQTG
ncbi:MAG: hypothetical protein J0H42_11370 [Rhizobiales bacterium]|nr:hypothetical protein [Hyphomicrobiales bacterium]